MRKISIIILAVGGSLTALLLLLWIAGFVFSYGAVGNLIHLLLLASMFTGFIAFVGLILLVVSFVMQKK